MRLDLLVGLFVFMISIADLLSLYIGVGLSHITPCSESIDCMYLMFFAAATAAMRSASVKLMAVIDCALD